MLKARLILYVTDEDLESKHGSIRSRREDAGTQPSLTSIKLEDEDNFKNHNSDNDDNFEGEDNDIGQEDSTDNESWDANETVTSDAKNSTEIYTCDVCQSILGSYSALRRHKIDLHGKWKNTCPECGLKFRLKRPLWKHMREVHNQSRNAIPQEEREKAAPPVFECVVCKVQYDSKDELCEHLPSHDGPDTTFRCSTCYPLRKVFNNSRLFLEHMEKHKIWSPPPILCDICGQVFRYQSKLKLHYDRVHLGKKFECEICGKHLKRKDELNLHILRHKKIYKFTCDICGKGFVSRSFLVQHQKSHQEIPESERTIYKCPHCDKNFRYPHTLKKHIRETHEQKFNFKCAICDKGFTYKAKLRDHEKTHSDERTIKCPQCDNYYKNKHTLAHHVRSTHEKKVYYCTYPNCTKFYASKMNWKYHLEAHAGNFKFTCEVCSKGFWIATDYKKHLKSHGIEHKEDSA